ncbi:MAG: Asp-tRNA(Asn)/Glu-tRNA(Gln) amidotransferase subunit GatC [Labilithrix sp.]|nr:Asp-tRNA(Asn)/Glu-tRNA(Gln) amidotransferase subunit GatC [Labilithrix sp.]MBX3225624.1 Asp-tRNA(Asn)/Glu-tRNA(Gln) amidotransferase subunit GatC [Labilithrix sp.]
MDRAQIRHVAVLAELELTADEEERLATEIGRLVAYVGELDAIDTTGVPPTAHVTAGAGSSSQLHGSPLRPDEPETGLAHDDALAGAPRTSHGGFSVPTFVE